LAGRLNNHHTSAKTNMNRLFLFGFFLTVSLVSSAQLYESALHVGWNVTVPLSDKEFTSKTSPAGVRIGYTKFLNDRFGFGVEGSFTTLDDYTPLRTYEFPGGAISAEVYNYLYQFTVMANLQYYFIQGDRFIPYASLGMGMAFSEYHIYYNAFEDQDSQNGFAIRPELGTLFRMKEYARWGFKGSISYEYAANKSEHLEVDNFSGLNFQIGVVFFTD
jgi:opacity protein-like surface antigen